MTGRLPMAAACLATVLCSACRAPGGPVEVARTEAGYELRVDGEPYFVKGVGGVDHFELLAASGGNAIRTWGADHIGPLLDQAQANGLKVAVGIWLEHERHGFDYDNPAAREGQLAKVRAAVEAYKDHPAVLVWGVGNEVTLASKDIDKSLRSIEEAAALVKSLDPNHPTMTVVPEIGDDLAARVKRQCPSVDILGVNSYAGINSLPQRLTQQGYDGPYLICEFGPPGHWEVGKSDFGEPFEPSSADKAKLYEEHYRNGILAEHPGRCLGSFAFLWGYKQEVTGTWYGMFLDSGESLPTLDMMTYLWSGEWPKNRAPTVRNIKLSFENLRVAPGAEFRATVDATDPDGDDLDIAWEIRHESTDRKSGGDHEESPERLEGHIDRTVGKSIFARAPLAPGKYRIFVVVRDGNGHAGTANLPFLVEAPKGTDD